MAHAAQVARIRTSPGGYPPPPGLAPPLHDVDEFLEVQPFAGDPGEYTWLRRARQEHEQTGWLPSAQEARRALLFVTGWIVRWEIFDQGYPATAGRPTAKESSRRSQATGRHPRSSGRRSSSSLDVPGQPARNVIYLALANVPGRGRSPWDIALREALMECARDAGTGGMFAEILWDVSGMLVLYVALDADPDSVAGVVECALALGR